MLCLLLAGGCSRNAAAPAVAGASQTQVCVLCDYGVKEGMNGYMRGWHTTTGRWMDQNLVKQLNKAGYQARLIKSRGEFQPGPSSYLIQITVTEVMGGHAGTSVGIALAGGSSMHSRYEIFGAEPQAITSNEEGAASSRSVRHCAQKRNRQAVEALNGIVARK
jgi:hypothetical protein